MDRGITSESTNHDLNGVRFDYDALPSPVATFLRGQADRIRRHCVTSIIQIGKALNESKRHLSHGVFLSWVEWEVRLPARTAQAYMRVASWAADKSAVVAHLSPSALYVLSASSTPNEFVAEILNRAEGGEFIAPATIRNELKAIRANRQQSLGNVQKSRIARGARKQTQFRNIDEREVHRFAEELAEFLMGALSAPDFERVRKLITSEVVLSDSKLSETLKQAFSFAGRMHRNWEEFGEAASGESR